jgi:hypothetical protein
MLEVPMATLREARQTGGRIYAEGHRRYHLAKLRGEMFRAVEAASRKTVTYAPVVA